MSLHPILQSGFISKNTEAIKRPELVESTFREAMIFKDFKTPLQKYFYAPQISELYRRWSAEPDSLKNFDFREEVLKQAIKCFGTNNFYHWLVIQSDKETVGNLHKVFLLETLEYLLYSKSRNIQNVQWIRLLEATEVANRVRIDVDKYFPANVKDTIPSSINKALALWCSKEDGFQDLLISLYVIFGDRSGRTQISNSAA